MAVSINNGSIFFTQSRNNAVFSQGKVVANSWTMIYKTNYVVGQIAGNYNAITTGINILDDTDLIDNPTNDFGIKSPIGASIVEMA